MPAFKDKPAWGRIQSLTKILLALLALSSHTASSQSDMKLLKLFEIACLSRSADRSVAVIHFLTQPDGSLYWVGDIQTLPSKNFVPAEISQTGTELRIDWEFNRYAIVIGPDAAYYYDFRSAPNARPSAVLRCNDPKQIGVQTVAASSSWTGGMWPRHAILVEAIPPNHKH